MKIKAKMGAGKMSDIAIAPATPDCRRRCAAYCRLSHLKFDFAVWFVLWSLPGFVAGQSDIVPGLVDQLATTNPPATIKGQPPRERATWSERDGNESKRVDAAIRDVIRQTEELWPELVAHLQDDRHCKTVGIDAGYPRNWSVGDLCQHIIGESLSEAYYRHMRGTKENFHRFNLPAFARDKAKLREWCEARKHRRLFELQMEACEWAITEIKASPMDAAEMQRLVTVINKEIEGMRRSRVAIRCRSAF